MHYEIWDNTRKPYRNEYALSTNFADVLAFHRSLPQYAPTPLRALPGFAAAHGLGAVYVKDEAPRFGLNAFKGLGVSYAVSRAVPPGTGVVACTDGNHGRALAWFAQQRGVPCRIFMPRGAEARRIRAIEQFGATVEVRDANYDDTVRYADAYAHEHGMVLVQDTAFAGYTDIPEHIVMGYTTLMAEALAQLPVPPTHVFVQAGVGSLAGGVCWYLLHHIKPLPYIGVLEASACPCLFQSVRDGQYRTVGGTPQTVMAGLNCGEPNVMTLPVIAHCARWMVHCDDDIAHLGMARAQHPLGGDAPFACGECGAISLGFLQQALESHEHAHLRLDERAVVLLISTEGTWD